MLLLLPPAKKTEHIFPCYLSVVAIWDSATRTGEAIGYAVVLFVQHAAKLVARWSHFFAAPEEDPAARLRTSLSRTLLVVDAAWSGLEAFHIS